MKNSTSVPVALTPLVSVVPESDELLVKKALAGDKSAFGQLSTRYEKRVFALVMELVRHREDAEDITQEVFVRAYFSLKNFRAESSFYTWLYRIAYNMTIDFKRRVARRPQEALSTGNSKGEDLNTEAVSDVQLPDEVIDSQQRQQSIRSALSGISEEHRAVILLREVDGLSYDEISRVTGSARGTVMSRLHYARKHLQKSLTGLRSGSGSGDHAGGPGSVQAVTAVDTKTELTGRKGSLLKSWELLSATGILISTRSRSEWLARKVSSLKLRLETGEAKA